MFQGACGDGSAAVFGGRRPTCSDGSRPDLTTCVCADGTALPTRGGNRGGQRGGRWRGRWGGGEN